MLLSRAGASPALCRSSTRQRSSTAAPAAAMSAAHRRGNVAAKAASATGGSNEDFKGDMLEPSAANKLPVRAAALAASVSAAAYFGAPAMSQSAGAFLHLLAVATFLGTAIWVSLIAGIVMFKNLPRQTFGRLQAKLFPLYFIILSSTAVVAFGTLAAASGGAAAVAGTFGGRALLVAAVGSLANALFLEPRATSVMFERYAIENKPTKTAEDTEKIAKLYKQFGALHGSSSLANLVALCAMVAYGWQLAQKIVLA